MVRPHSPSQSPGSGDTPRPDFPRTPKPSESRTVRTLLFYFIFHPSSFAASISVRPDPSWKTHNRDKVRYLYPLWRRFLRIHSEQKKARTIDDVPDEALLIIFDFATAPTSPSNPDVHDFRQAVRLTHVSYRWREILLDHGPMWSDIHICGQDIDMLSTRIERCKHASLFVSIKNPRAPTTTSSYSELQENVWEAAKLIRDRRNQVTRLEVRLECGFFQRFLGFEWPALEELVWNDTCLLHSSLHGGSYDKGLPKLRYLTIKGGFDWTMKVAKNLTTLKLQGPLVLELAVFAELLRMNTSLESLNLSHLNAQESPGHRREEPINLPHLDTLSVFNATCGCALTLLTLPSLKTLVVSSSNLGRSFWSDSPWSDFVNRLSITSLEAWCSPPSNENIRVVGSNGPDTLPLYLKDSSSKTTIVALFRSLSNPSLSSVTSFSFINNMPEGVMSPEQISVTCDLLKHLSRVECMRLCPSGLVVEALRRLRDDSGLCPELRKLDIMVSAEALWRVMNLVDEVLEAWSGEGDEVLKARSGKGDGWEKRITKYEYCIPPMTQVVLERRGNPGNA